MQYHRVGTHMHKLHPFLAKKINHSVVQLLQLFLHYGCTIDAIICSATTVGLEVLETGALKNRDEAFLWP